MAAGCSGPQGLNNIAARLLLAATRGELDDRWLKTAFNSERVALQSQDKQRVLITIPGETQILPSQDTVYGSTPTSASRRHSGWYAPAGVHRRTILTPQPRSQRQPRGRICSS